MNQNQIEKIAKLENQTIVKKEYVLTGFVVLAILICCFIAAQFASLRHDMTITEEQLVAEKLIGLYMALAASVGACFLFSKMFNRQLNKLWELKKTCF